MKKISVYYWIEEDEIILSSSGAPLLVDNEARMLGFRPNNVDYCFLGYI